MNSKKIFTLLILLSFFIVGCKNNESNPSANVSNDDSALTKSWMQDSFKKFNSAPVREVECHDKSTGFTVIQTSDDVNSAFFKASNTVNEDGNPISDSQVLTKVNDIEYLYYQTDVYNEDGSLNEVCTWHKKQDTDNTYSACQSATTLSIDNIKSIKETDNTTIDNIPITKVTAIDSADTTITYYFNKKTKTPLKAETDKFTYIYRLDKECLFFAIPTTFIEE